jgi:hypothetical protein
MTAAAAPDAGPDEWKTIAATAIIATARPAFRAVPVDPAQVLRS